MDFSLTTLGCSLFSSQQQQRRRKLAAALPTTATRQQSPEDLDEDDTFAGSNASNTIHKHSCRQSQDSFTLLAYLKRIYQKSLGGGGGGGLPLMPEKLLHDYHPDHHCDDDTATTLSSSSSEDERMVTFCDPLVTAVYTRPITTKEDKYYLHYNEHDYVDFKVEYMTGRERNRKVSFAREHEVILHDDDHDDDDSSNHHDKKALYYSEAELQE